MEAQRKSVELVVAATEEGGIGMNGSIPWRIKEDMNFFKQVTSQTTDPQKRNAVVMGRKTWESIPAKFRPLRDRHNVVLSTNPAYPGLPAEVELFSSLPAALEALQQNPAIETIFIIGGGEIYRQALQQGLCTKIYTTVISSPAFECDVFFPMNFEGFREEPQYAKEENGINFRFLVFTKE